MSKPRNVSSHTFLCLTLLLALAFPLNSNAHSLQLDSQDSQKHYEAAEKYLKDKNYENALVEAESALKSDAGFAKAYYIKGQALIGIFNKEYVKNHFAGGKKTPNAIFSTMKEAVESYEHYLNLSPQAPNRSDLMKLIQLLKPYGDLVEVDNPARKLFLIAEIQQTKARLLSKPEPQYTEDAREARANGTVALMAILNADGTVSNVLVIKPLSHGLTETSIDALRQIKFAPATKDGRAVSQVIEAEYTFQTN